VAALSYLESICADVGAANLLVSSALPPALVRMLAPEQPPALRLRAATLLGLLLRHCTWVDDRLAATGARARCAPHCAACPRMHADITAGYDSTSRVECMRAGLVHELARVLRQDGCARVRRRAMGTLGELLFYVAAQQRDPAGACAWAIPAAATDAVAAALGAEEEEDAIVQVSSLPLCAAAAGTLQACRRGWTVAECAERDAQHYAVKTVENLASARGGQRGPPWLDALAGQQTAERLLRCWAAASSDALRAAAACALCRLTRHRPHLLPALLQHAGAAGLVRPLPVSRAASRDCC
jgi:serine/threonine-protein kinase ULK4